MSNDRPPWHFSSRFKEGVHIWARDMVEGEEYLGTTAVCHTFKKEGGQVFFRKNWEHIWYACSPAGDSVLARKV